MRYLSTRGGAPPTDFAGAVLEGLAPDGGLYLPETWPTLSPDQLRGLRGAPYVDVALAVLTPLVGEAIPAATLRALCADAWCRFDDPAVAPLTRLGPDNRLLELFHGPTLAFKDVALQLLGRLYGHLLAERGERRTVLGATSGDTGSAAIEGCRGLPGLDVFILHPEGRPSDVQRRQMTTVLDPNVHNAAVRGTFDDCQELVKALFRDPAARSELKLTAVNSISWARVAAQIVYFVTAALQLGAPDVEVDFTVPTGNFGDIFAGWCARRMGVPIRRLVIATNRNDLLERVLDTGRYEVRGVHPTLSPSMDIQVSSNFERLLFEEGGRDPRRVVGWMEDLRRDGAFTVGDDVLARLRATFGAASVDDDTTRATMRDVYARTGTLIDPHTAVGVAAARARPLPGAPMVVLATAHPAKFPDAVLEATGVHPALPPRLADLFDRPERCEHLDADVGAVRRWIDAARAPAPR
jgi:threonine synthase